MAGRNDRPRDGAVTPPVRAEGVTASADGAPSGAPSLDLSLRWSEPPAGAEASEFVRMERTAAGVLVRVAG